jgi:hypothetical protein
MNKFISQNKTHRLGKISENYMDSGNFFSSAELVVF